MLQPNCISRAAALGAAAFSLALVPALIAQPLQHAQPQAATDAQLAWLAENAYPIATTDPAGPTADLQFLGDLLEGVSVVGLGEASHGTREHFQLKHRIFKHLVEHEGYRVFAIEASAPESFAVNDYIQRGEGTAAKAAQGMLFWTWSTEEVRDMIEWMRSWNVAHPDDMVHFTGFDMQFIPSLAGPLGDMVERLDPPVAEELSTRLAESEWRIETLSSEPAYFFSKIELDLDDVMGKTVEMSCDVKTALNGTDSIGAGQIILVENADGLYAHAGDDGSFATGNSPWRRTSDSLKIDPEATKVSIALVYRGSGVAWFDDVRVTVDGEPHDFTPEGGSFEQGLGALAITQGTAASTRDDTVAREGDASMRVERTIVPGDPVEAALATQALIDALDEHRPALEKTLGARDAAWARRLAVMIDQNRAMAAAATWPLKLAARDRAMAKNTLWIRDQFPGEKIVVWAHNSHVSITGFWQGRHLEDALGDAYVAVGFEAASGDYRAAKMGEGVFSGNPIQQPAPHSVAETFLRLNRPLALYDLRDAVKNDPASGWAWQPSSMMHIGAGVSAFQWQPGVPREGYEMIIFTEETTSARGLEP